MSRSTSAGSGVSSRVGTCSKAATRWSSLADAEPVQANTHKGVHHSEDVREWPEGNEGEQRNKPHDDETPSNHRGPADRLPHRTRVVPLKTGVKGDWGRDGQGFSFYPDIRVRVGEVDTAPRSRWCLSLG